jgi:glyoxylase-like metal-dependent hydrolase (beta-lactamase superfamily II)
MIDFLFRLSSLLPLTGPYDYDQVNIAPGVYGFFERALNPIVSGNIIAVVGERGVLVFDSGHHPPITREIVGAIKRLTDQPVRYLVVSHWHDDHWVGNAEFAEAYPELEVIAHPYTAAVMEQRKDQFAGAVCREELTRDSQSLRDQLASGKRADGSALSDASRERLQRFVDATDEQLRQCDQMRYRGVDRQVARKRKIDLGGRTVEIEFLGRGNTAGDLIAYLPESKTILTGDIVVSPFPFATASYVTEWARVLRRIERMDLSTIVPGHGASMKDKAYVSDVALVLESIARQARAAYRPGMTAEELRTRIDLTELSQKFSHGDPFIKANFDRMMGQLAVDRMWQELTGKWKPELE